MEINDLQKRFSGSFLSGTLSRFEEYQKSSTPYAAEVPRHEIGGGRCTVIQSDGHKPLVTLIFSHSIFLTQT